MSAASPQPDWLPDIIPFQGNWDVFVRALYRVFDADFKSGSPRFRNRPLWHDRRILPDDPLGYEEGFWHLVTRDQWRYNHQTRRREKERLPEFDRAARLPWARPITRNETSEPVLAWEFEEASRRGKAIRVYLWLKALDYVVILERQSKRMGDIYMLVTSFLVEHEAKRRDLESRYARRIK
jgi:hypothetical protein